MPATKIVKRTGEVVAFDRARIRNAVAKAVRAGRHRVDPARARRAGRSRRRRKWTRASPTSSPTSRTSRTSSRSTWFARGCTRSPRPTSSTAPIVSASARPRSAHDVERARLGRLTVRTRDGRTVLFNLKKLRDDRRAARRRFVPDVSVERVVQEAMRTVHDGISTTQIGRALTLAAAAFIERDPAYSPTRRAAAPRSDVHRRGRAAATRRAPDGRRRRTGTGCAFRRAIRRRASAAARVSTSLRSALTTSTSRRWPRRCSRSATACCSISASRRWPTAISPARRRAARAAAGLLDARRHGPGDRRGRSHARAIEFYDLMSRAALRAVDADAVPRRHAASAALVLLPDDRRATTSGTSSSRSATTRSSPSGRAAWATTGRTSARTGARIASTNVESQGVVPFLKVANDVTMAINRSGKRRGATCAYLETWHYDVEDFLDLRRNTGDERRRTHDMNTANWIPDLFMKRVIEDGPWTLFSPDEVPDLHDLYGQRVRGALPRVRGIGRARRHPPVQDRAGHRAVAEDADDAVRDRASVDHLQGSVQRPVAAGPRRRRPQLQPVHRDHAQHELRRDRGVQPRLGQSGPPRRRRHGWTRRRWRGRSRPRSACSTTSSTSTSTRPRSASSRTCAIGRSASGSWDSRTRCSCSTCRSSRRRP